MRSAQRIAGLDYRLPELLQECGLEKWGVQEWDPGLLVVYCMFDPSTNPLIVEFCMASYHFIIQFTRGSTEWPSVSNSNYFWTRRTGVEVSSVRKQNNTSAMYCFIHYWWVIHSRKIHLWKNISRKISTYQNLLKNIKIWQSLCEDLIFIQKIRYFYIPLHFV